MAAKPKRRKSKDDAPVEGTLIQSGGVDLDADQVTVGADIVGRDKIVNNIQNIHERALTAAEEAEREHAIEARILAQGVSMFAQRLQARASETADTAKGSPYKGLLEYRLSDAEIFFGRAKAIRDVLGCLQNGPLTVLQSESGAGKTSLLQAGISPRLIAAGHLPLYLRPYNVEPAYVIKRAFISDPSLTPTLATAPLRDFLRQVCAVLGPKVMLYIFLDQFEEFFTLLDDPARDEFVRELAECLDDESLNVCWLLALRAEYFGNLANFRPRIRNPFENDYRLNRLTRAEAAQVITEPAAQRGVAFEPGLVDTLLDDLGKNEIAPPQLQLVCAALFDELTGGEMTITRALYAREDGAAGILRGYLEQVLSRNLRREDRAAARWVLESLISSEQQRIIRTHTELVDELGKRGVTPQTLDTILTQLVDSRLLRTEETDAGVAYELAHDYLLQEIRLDPEVQARKAAQELLEQEVRAYRRHKTLLTEDRLKVIEPYRNELTFTPEAEALFTESQKAVQRERAARERRRNALLASALIVAVIMALLGVFGLSNAAEAGRQAATATYALGVSEARGTEVAQQAATAEAASALAAKERDEARRQSQIAFVRQLGAQSIARLNDRFDLALLLSLETARVAGTIGDTFEGRNSPLRVLEHNPQLTAFLHGHTGAVWSVAFSPDGKTLASGSTDNTVILWDVASRQLLGEPLTGHTDSVLSVAFSLDGKTLASGSDDGSIRLWDVSAALNTSVATRQRLGEPLTGHTDAVWSVAFSPDGQTLASGSADRSILLWDVASRQQLGEPLTGHTDAVWSVAFSPDGKTLASSSADRIILWDVASRQRLGEPLIGHTDTVLSVAFSPDGKTLASGSGDKTILLWDVASRQRLGEPLTGHTDQVRSVAFSPDGKTLASGSVDGSILLWDVASRQWLGEPLTGHTDTVWSVAFSPDGMTLASGSADSSIRLWDAATGQRLGEPLTGHTNSVWSMAFSPDGETLASGSVDGSILLWDVASRQRLGEPLTGHTDSVFSVAFSPDGMTLASGSADSSIRLWDVATRQRLGEPLTGHTFWVQSVAFSPDGKTLASGSWDNTILLWNVASRQRLGEPLTGHTDAVRSVAFSPDGKTLASGSDDDSIILWDVASRQRLGEPLTGHTNPVYSVAFSPDGKTLASGSSDGSIILWDVASRQRLGEPLTGHTNSVWSMAFSPDGKTLASGSYDGSIILWDIDHESWITRACEIAGRNFTRSEWARYFAEVGIEYHKTCEQWPEGK